MNISVIRLQVYPQGFMLQYVGKDSMFEELYSYSHLPWH